MDWNFLRGETDDLTIENIRKYFLGKYVKHYKCYERIVKIDRVLVNRYRGCEICYKSVSIFLDNIDDVKCAIAELDIYSPYDLDPDEYIGIDKLEIITKEEFDKAFEKYVDVKRREIENAIIYE